MPGIWSRSGVRQFLSMAALLVILVLVAVINRQRTRGKPALPPAVATPSSYSQSNRPAVAPLELPGGQPVDLVINDQLLYVLTEDPPLLLHVDPYRAGTVLQSAPVAAGSRLLLFDGRRGQLWVVSGDDRTSTIRDYDALSLSPGLPVRLPFAITAATALEGNLWLGTPNGLYVLSSERRVAGRSAAVTGEVSGVVSDLARGQVLVASSGRSGSALVGLEAATGKPVARASLPLHRVSVATTAREVWVAGYDEGPHRLAIHLDGQTLRPIGSLRPDPSHSAGALVWAGETVIWLRPAASTDLWCVGAADGVVRGHWSGVIGPVVSRAGVAYAVGRASVLVLSLTGQACREG